MSIASIWATLIVSALAASLPAEAVTDPYQEWTECLIKAALPLVSSSMTAEKIANASIGTCVDHERRARWKFEDAALKRGLRIPPRQVDTIMDDGRRTVRRLLLELVANERLKGASRD